MDPKDLRFERKFVVNGLHPDLIDAWVMRHPACFRRPFPDRQINNIYYDTSEMRCFHENLAGVNQRRKYRVRWYDTFHGPIRKAKLESKFKHNELGGKDRYPIKIEDAQNPPSLAPYELQLGLRGLIPVLANSYERRYYLSADRKFRLTLDWNISFCSYLIKRSHFTLDVAQPECIIEIKYLQKDDQFFGDIAMHFPFRRNKNSKYSTGIFLTNS